MLHISLKAEELFHIGSFPVTNSYLMTLLAMLVLAGASFFIFRRLSLVPRGVQNTLEMVVEGALGLMESVLGERRRAEKYLPLVATIFLLVLVSNWLGIFPGVGSIGLSVEGHGEEVPGLTPFFRPPAGDLNFTLAIAIITVVAVNLIAVLILGLRARAKVFFNFKNPVYFFVGILELISEFAKIISFSFRLYGNIFAGEVLLVIVGFLLPFIAPIPFFFLELFVGLVQAFVFAMLALVFLAIATAEVEH